MKLFGSLLAIFLSSLAVAQSANETTIAFGSCDNEEKPQEMWKEIIAHKPVLWIWGGDNVYANDGEGAAARKQRYDKQKSNIDYQQLLKICAVTGTWDDHDYGTNDGGDFFQKSCRIKNRYLSSSVLKKQTQYGITPVCIIQQQLDQRIKKSPS